MSIAPRDDRRGAQRIALEKSVPTTFGGFTARMVELSLIGCQIEHEDRIVARSRLPLRFKWRGAIARIDATLVRSEMRAIGGKPMYYSGIEFCASPEESPAVVREIIGWLERENAKNAPPPASEPVVEAEEEAESLSADFLQCTLADGEWTRLYVNDPQQPADGFTIAVPSNESEVDVLCRAYETAGFDKRRAMRKSFEQRLMQKAKT
jgi:hypothetical protein